MLALWRVYVVDRSSAWPLLGWHKHRSWLTLAPSRRIAQRNVARIADSLIEPKHNRDNFVLVATRIGGVSERDTLATLLKEES